MTKKSDMDHGISSFDGGREPDYSAVTTKALPGGGLGVSSFFGMFPENYLRILELYSSRWPVAIVTSPFRVFSYLNSNLT